MQKIVVTEKGLEQKREMKKEEEESPDKNKVQFDEQFLIENIRNKRKSNDKANQSKSIFSAKPYFLECKEALEKTMNLNDTLNTDNNTNKPQYPGMFPPHNQFTTFSKRFPYDQPMRATTSQQELRKRIIQSNDVKSIQEFFSPPSSSHTKFRQKHIFPQSTKSEMNVNRPSLNEAGQEEHKEIKTILQNMGSNQQNTKQKFLSQSQFYLKQDAMPQTERNNANKNNLVNPDTLNPVINININNNSNNNNQKNNSPLKLDLFSNKQQDVFSKNSESKPSRPSIINQIGAFTPQNMRKEVTPLRNLNIQHNNTNDKHEEFFDNPMEKVSSAPKSQSKKFIPTNFSPIKGGIPKFHSVSNLSQIQASMMLNESVLQNKIHKWQLKKQHYQQSDKQLQSIIQKKVTHILEEKGNKPVHVATNFIVDLKNADAEIDELYEGTTKQRKRYQERLKLFHIKKYKTFFSDYKMHTAQLTDKHHQIAHLGQRILESVKNDNINFETLETKPTLTVIKNK